MHTNEDESIILNAGFMLRPKRYYQHISLSAIYTYLNIAAVDVHASDHAALGGHICPINHLLAIVEIQSYSIVQALSKHRSCISLGKRFTPVCRISKHFKRIYCICKSHLFEQCVVGAI